MLLSVLLFFFAGGHPHKNEKSTRDHTHVGGVFLNILPYFGCSCLTPGVPPGSFWGFVDGAPALEVSTTLHGTGSVVAPRSPKEASGRSPKNSPVDLFGEVHFTVLCAGFNKFVSFVVV